MNNVDILEIINYSGLNKFLYKKINEQIIQFYKTHDKYILIQLNLSVKELWFIKLNFDQFKEILDNLLFLYNNKWNNYYQNITFNTVTSWYTTYNNCIFIFKSNNEKKWYIKTNSYIKLNNLIPNQTNKKDELLINVINLIKNKNISVRNLMNLWIHQGGARNLYEFFKNKNVFKISEYNQNHKTYNLEEAKKNIKKRYYIIFWY